MVRTTGGRMQSPSVEDHGRSTGPVSGEYQSGMASLSWIPVPAPGVRESLGASTAPVERGSRRREVAMSEEAGDRRQQDGSSLHDYSTRPSAGSGPGGPSRGPAVLGEPSDRALRRSRTMMVAVIGGSVVVVGVIALILSHTVFRSAMDHPGPTACATGTRAAEGQSEYVPH